MALFLADTRDHALLAMVVKEASLAAEGKGGFVGRTAVQKLMYFLRVLGVPMGYRFDLHTYGPFCEQILNDMEWLMADRVVVDRSDRPGKYSNYAPGENVEALLSKHRKKIDPFLDQVREVVRALVPLRPERLELIATLDYLYRQRKGSTSKGGLRKDVLSRFRDVKGDKFPLKEVEDTYDLLVEAGLLEA